MISQLFDYGYRENIFRFVTQANDTFFYPSAAYAKPMSRSSIF